MVAASVTKTAKSFVLRSTISKIMALQNQDKQFCSEGKVLRDCRIRECQKKKNPIKVYDKK